MSGRAAEGVGLGLAANRELGVSCQPWGWMSCLGLLDTLSHFSLWHVCRFGISFHSSRYQLPPDSLSCVSTNDPIDPSTRAERPPRKSRCKLGCEPAVHVSPITPTPLPVCSQTQYFLLGFLLIACLTLSSTAFSFVRPLSSHQTWIQCLLCHCSHSLESVSAYLSMK